MNIRRAERPNTYTNVDNAVINDPNISASCLGVLIYLLSKPDNWTAVKKEIIKRFSTAKNKLTTNSLDNCFREMREAGYAEIKPKMRLDSAGKMQFCGSEYLIFDKPKPPSLEDSREPEDVPSPEDVPTSEILEAPKYRESLTSTYSNLETNNPNLETKEDIRANKLPAPIASDSVFENKSSQESLPLKAEPAPEKEKSCAKKEKEPKRTFVAEFRDVMATFETLTPNRFKVPTTDALIKRSGKYVLVHARLLEGYTVEDLKAVISTKSKEWSDSPKMKQYLTPDTLFAKRNIEKYLDQHHSEQANAQPVARPRPMADVDFYNKIANSQKL